MSVVTLHSGRVVNLTPANADDAVREQLAAYQQQGADVNAPGFAAGIMEAIYAAAGKPYDTSSRQAAQREAAAVLSNPLVQASDTVFAAEPAALQSVTQTVSDAVAAPALAAGQSALNNTKRAGLALAYGLLDSGKALADKIPDVNRTIVIVAIAAAVVVGGGGAAYLVYRFKRS